MKNRKANNSLRLYSMLCSAYISQRDRTFATQTHPQISHADTDVSVLIRTTKQAQQYDLKASNLFTQNLASDMN